MGLIDGIKSLLKSSKPADSSYANLLNGSWPIFSQFGQNIYSSDVVQQAINCIATEISKLQPRHVRFADDMQINVNSSLSKLLKRQPNELMTTRDFLEKITWLLFLNYNVFIYPMYDTKIEQDGTISRNYKALYPLQPDVVQFLQDQSGKLFVEMQFKNGMKSTLPYDRLIHWRYRYSVNEFMGGNENGQPDTTALLKTVQMNHSLLESVSKSLEFSMKIHGLLKINTMLDGDKMKSEIERFETMITNNKSSILPTDLKSEYVPIKPDPKLVDPETLIFIDSKILRHYGVSLPILTGDYTDEQYQAFYEKTLEPLIISLGQAFTKDLFSEREKDFNNEVIFYPNKLLFTNTDKKVAIADILGNRGALTNNELLEMFGYPPYPDGNVRLMSLNYVDAKIANQYQMQKAKVEGGGENAKNEK